MSTEQNKAIARRFYEAFETYDEKTFNEILVPDLVAHTHSAAGSENRETMLQGIRFFREVFSGLRFTIEDLVAEGDRVVARTTMRGVHAGNFMGHPPTGRQIEVSGIAIELIKDGKIVERWAIFDQQLMMQQLGLLPQT
jgi:steroid delta-isomerase-like uncharacterized protein